MAFIKAGKYVINTNKISFINTDKQAAPQYSSIHNGKVAVEMVDDYTIYVSQEDAEDLIEWAIEVTAKCEYCERFDCNCGGGDKQ